MPAQRRHPRAAAPTNGWPAALAIHRDSARMQAWTTSWGPRSQSPNPSLKDPNAHIPCPAVFPNDTHGRAFQIQKSNGLHPASSAAAAATASAAPFYALAGDAIPFYAFAGAAASNPFSGAGEANTSHGASASHILLATAAATFCCAAQSNAAVVTFCGAASYPALFDLSLHCVLPPAHPMAWPLATPPHTLAQFQSSPQQVSHFGFSQPPCPGMSFALVLIRFRSMNL